MVILSSAIMTFSTSSRTPFACFLWRAIERRRKTLCPAKQFSYPLGGPVGGAEELKQLRRVGERVEQDPDHGIFDFRRSEPQTWRAVASGLRDRGAET